MRRAKEVELVKSGVVIDSGLGGVVKFARSGLWRLIWCEVLFAPMMGGG